MLKKTIPLLFILGSCVSVPSLAESKDECKAMVESAAAFCASNPADKCFKEINGSRFKKGELFIFAFDFSGKSVANGGIPSMIGKNMASAKSADGQLFIQKQIEIAKKGSGWLEYDWINPGSQKIQKKLAYVKKVNDQFYVGSGIHQ